MSFLDDIRALIDQYPEKHIEMSITFTPDRPANLSVGETAQVLVDVGNTGPVPLVGVQILLTGSEWAEVWGRGVIRPSPHQLPTGVSPLAPHIVSKPLDIAPGSVVQFGPFAMRGTASTAEPPESHNYTECDIATASIKSFDVDLTGAEPGYTAPESCAIEHRVVLDE